ncbi:MAG: fluoride efflux transporter CrcB [Dehalococcoidia bacterium]|nr:fluoride efflux transporter CrcB [Dehalococcoidia bacterium]
MLPVLLVALGGATGAVARYLTVRVVQSTLQASFPYGTLAVNVSGCLLIGLLFGLAEGRNWLTPNFRAFLSVGFLGGFTTFSAFGYETIALVRDGLVAQAALNVVLQLVVGLAAVALGLALSHLLRGAG